MIKKRWYLFPIIGVFALGLILGSFFDLEINRAIYDRSNGFATFLSAFGETPFYAGLGILGYAFFYLTSKYQKKIVKIALFVGVFATFVASVYFQGKHIFDINAYNNEKLLWLGFVIAIILYALGVVAGYFIFKGTEVSPAKITLVLLTLVVAFGLSVLATQLFKSLMSRPRYRFLYEENILSSFRNWWQNGKDLKEAYEGRIWSDLSGVITKEEFKSFPSGHMSTCICTVLMYSCLPLFNDKLKVKQEVFLISACVWNVILAYSRMRMGAHFLSDVSMGALLGLVFIVIANEVYPVLEKKLIISKEKEPLNQEVNE